MNILSIMEDNKKTMDDIDMLDPFADNVEILQYDYPNPFFISLDGSPIQYIKNKFLASEYKNIYILCLTDNFVPSDENKNRIKLFHNNKTDISELKMNSGLVTLIKGPFTLVQQPSVRRGLVIIDKNVLGAFNDKSHNLDDKELVYLMLEAKESRVQKWLEIYDDETNLDEFIEQKIFTSYYQLDDQKINDNLLRSINNVNNFKYWDNEKNCDLDINTAFNNRRLNMSLINKFKLLPSQDFDKELQNILKNFDNDSVKNTGAYPVQITNPDVNIKLPTHVDASNAKYKTFFPITDIEKLHISVESVEELLLSNSLSEKEKYYLICNILSSRKYCHYVINNGRVLDANQDLFTKYKPIFRYLIGYAWISLYMEESIKKTKTKLSDRYVFDLDVACKLPVFPFSPSAPHLNPYFSLLVSNTNINYSNNIIGAEQSLDYQNGIVNLETFKKRLNIFMTGNANINILEGVNWENMVITGGVMSAILPTGNSLMALFTKNKNDITDIELDRFFQEYYSKSDIDVACNFSNILDFIDHVKNMRSTIHKNIQNNNNISINESEIHIIPNKTLAIYINSQLLKQKCDDGTVPYIYDYIVKNTTNNDVKLYFYEMYLGKKIQSNINNSKILGNKINDDQYFEINKMCTIDKITIIINDHISEVEVQSHRSPEMNSGLDQVYYIMNNSTDTTNEKSDDDDFEMHNDVFIKFTETLKYKITSKYLRHTFEIFRINTEHHFACVARFHLPCVRSYYNGTKCYLLPSAITSYHTFTNIDFKYFVGSHDPINIIDKYRNRGYSTILNKQEIALYLLYLSDNKQYQKKYCIEDIKNAKKVLGPLPIVHSYFKPRLTLSEEFITDPGVTNDYIQVPNIKLLLTKKDVIEHHKKEHPKYSDDLIDKTTISTSGQINPIKYWMIDAAYDYLQ